MSTKSKHTVAILQAVLAAALYALSAPFSKMLLQEMPPMMTVAFLYLGAGLGMSIIGVARKIHQKKRTEYNLTRKELPYTIAMVVLDIAAPIFLMFGLTMTTAANASLLNNFEIVATAIIALFIFKEAINRRLWFAIVLITLSSILISVESVENFSFSIGSLFVLMACICFFLCICTAGNRCGKNKRLLCHRTFYRSSAFVARSWRTTEFTFRNRIADNDCRNRVGKYGQKEINNNK